MSEPTPQTQRTERLPRHRTGDPELDRRIVDLLDAAGAVEDRDQLFEIVASAVLLAQDKADRLDLKITNAALKEMRNAFRMFAPYHGRPKVTIFGSARTTPDDPLYQQTRDAARALAAKGWMVVTGAGPGIMAAGVEGAGIESAIGVNIRLPFEQEPSEFIAGDRLVSMKYFFTRKLMLMKESAGFLVLPGGFGTLDEAFELFTLVQTGKSEPKPIVLLEVSGGTYWKTWEAFMRNEVAARGLVSTHDLELYRITDDANAAGTLLRRFYRNYDSVRWVGDRLVLRLKAEPTDDELQDLNHRFAEMVASGSIERTGPLQAEVADDDKLDLPRLVLRFDRRHWALLHDLIWQLDDLDSAPPLD
jgi:uncharacterized protein (TIGR00730 family)